MRSGQLVQETEISLREWLRNSRSQPGDRIPSARAIAKQLGFERSYALTRAMGALIAEGTIEKIGYKLYYRASSRIPAAFTCHLVIHKRSAWLPTYRKAAKKIEINLDIHGWESIEEAAALLTELGSKNAEGILFNPPPHCPAALWEPTVTRLTEHGIAVVSVREYTKKIPCVIVNHTQAWEEMTEHLEELGHREIARVLGSIISHPADSGKHNTFVQKSVHTSRRDARELAEKLSEEWKRVTALLISWDSAPMLPFLLEELSRRGRRVPDDLSMLCNEDVPELKRCEPPISSMACDERLVVEIAFRQIHDIVLRKKELGFLPSAACIRVDKHLLQRYSTAPAPGFTPPRRIKTSPESEIVPATAAWEENPEKLRRKLESSARRAYELAAKNPESRFKTIDLSSFVNRPLNYRRGWLGDLPLTNFPPGRHVIHGVPFHVLGGSRRSDCGAIVFRSTTNSTGNARKLPNSLTIPIDARVSAIYILHGCGYALFLQPFATYAIFQGSKKIATVPLVALGKPPADYDHARFSSESGNANIQDWWPEFTQMNFPNARFAPVTESNGAESLQSHPCLYTLEWTNPKPKCKVSHLEISVDSTLPTTLGVLALSMLLT